MNRGEQEKGFLIRGMKYILARTHEGGRSRVYGVASHSIHYTHTHGMDLGPWTKGHGNVFLFGEEGAVMDGSGWLWEVKLRQVKLRVLESWC